MMSSIIRTAHDMALIASAVYQFEEFRTVTQTLNYTIGPTNLVGESRTFQQNHKMLWEGGYYYYEYCTGGKTGYTDQSRTTLVTMADNGDMRLVGGTAPGRWRCICGYKGNVLTTRFPIFRRCL